MASDYSKFGEFYAQELDLHAKLRDPQREVLQSLEARLAFAEERQKLMAVLPTGVGKTAVMTCVPFCKNSKVNVISVNARPLLYCTRAFAQCHIFCLVIT